MRDILQYLKVKIASKILLLNPSQPPFAKGRNNIPLRKRGSKGDFDASRDNGALHPKSL